MTDKPQPGSRWPDWLVWYGFLALGVGAGVVGVWAAAPVAEAVYRATGEAVLEDAVYLVGLFAGPFVLVWLMLKRMNTQWSRQAKDSPPSHPTILAMRLRELAEARDAGLIDDEEFERKRAEIIERF